MSISQSKKLSATEKKLHLLSLQLYGKESKIPAPTVKLTSTMPPQVQYPPQQIPTTFLRQDLVKILILATVAITAQISLYLVFNHSFLKIN